MLLNFSFRNFFSFNEGATISFMVSNSCPEDIRFGDGYVNILGIKGANASGKTNILRALSFLSDFCIRSFANEPGKLLGISSFYGSTAPSEFCVEFANGNETYIYELKVDSEKIHYEALYRKMTRKTKMFERVFNDIKFHTSEFKDISTMKLRSNASIIATAKQYEIKLVDNVFGFFQIWLSNVTFLGLSEENPSLYRVAKHLKDDKDSLDFVKKFIADCDNGICDIFIKEVSNESGEALFVPIFVHEYNGSKYEVAHIYESSGTKTLFRYLLLYRLAVERGGLLIMDEFDINLHPHILPKLLNLFNQKVEGRDCAQLIFTTHNSEVLDWLGRYRCYLVNKEANESYVYRLDEIPGDVLRNDRPILPTYNRGDIGGVPRI